MSFQNSSSASLEPWGEDHYSFVFHVFIKISSHKYSESNKIHHFLVDQQLKLWLIVKNIESYFNVKQHLIVYR